VRPGHAWRVCSRFRVDPAGASARGAGLTRLAAATDTNGIFTFAIQAINVSAARTITSLVCGLAYALGALPGVVVAAWWSPWLPGTADGRIFGAVVMILASAWMGTSYGRRYVDGHPGAVMTPVWVALYSMLITAFVWGYGYAWLVEASVSRISVLGPLVGLFRGMHFAVLLLASALPLLAPAWWLVNRMLQRHAMRLYAAAL
jgi:hypothetical protein